jgi:hypothetical protein
VSRDSLRRVEAAPQVQTHFVQTQDLRSVEAPRLTQEDCTVSNGRNILLLRAISSSVQSHSSHKFCVVLDLPVSFEHHAGRFMRSLISIRDLLNAIVGLRTGGFSADPIFFLSSHVPLPKSSRPFDNVGDSCHRGRGEHGT